MKWTLDKVIWDHIYSQFAYLAIKCEEQTTSGHGGCTNYIFFLVAGDDTWVDLLSWILTLWMPLFKANFISSP